jgi:hypothetical protein
MLIRKLYVFIYAFALVGVFLACHIIIPAMNELHYVSLLFTTIASSLLYFLPTAFPKRITNTSWTRVKLYVVLTVYTLIVLAVSYYFSFEFTMNSSFYFLSHTIGLAVVLFILAVITISYNKKTIDKTTIEDDIIDENVIE